MIRVRLVFKFPSTMLECNISFSAQFNSSLEYFLNESKNGTNTTAEADADSYDGFGAMQFTIITVTVYAAMGVFCTLINNIRRKTNKHSLRTQDEAVIKYLKSEKSLKLQGFHMQLRTLRNKYTEMVRQYEEKKKLMEIQKELENMDQGTPQLKRARQTRKLSLFHIHQGIKGKFGGRKRPSMDTTLGKMGFSLLHLVNTGKPASLSEDEEGMTSQRDSIVSDIDKSDKGNEKPAESTDTCVVDIEDLNYGASVDSIEVDRLLPPITSNLSESV